MNTINRIFWIATLAVLTMLPVTSQSALLGLSKSAPKV